MPPEFLVSSVVLLGKRDGRQCSLIGWEFVFQDGRVQLYSGLGVEMHLRVQWSSHIQVARVPATLDQPSNDGNPPYSIVSQGPEMHCFRFRAVSLVQVKRTTRQSPHVKFDVQYALNELT